MTKKDYEMIAATLWLTKPLLISYKTPEDWQIALKQWRQTLSILGLTLANANPRFKLVEFNGIAHGGKDWNTELVGINWADGTTTIHTDKDVKTVPTDQIQQ